METGTQHAEPACAESRDALVLEPAILKRAQETFTGIAPWRGFAPKELGRNFLGAVAPDERNARVDPDFEEIELRQTDLPEPHRGEAFL